MIENASFTLALLVNKETASLRRNRTGHHRSDLCNETMMRPTLFETACSKVTIRDIESYVLNDPGHSHYITAWSNVLLLKEVPTWNGDLSEEVGCLPLSNEGVESRELWYRIFVRSATIRALENGFYEEELPYNYVLLGLLSDLDAVGYRDYTECANYMERVSEILQESYGKADALFIILVALILRVRDGDYEGAERLAHTMRVSDREVRKEIFGGEQYGALLWDSTCYKQYHQEWMKVLQALNSQTPLLSLLYQDLSEAYEEYSRV